jgi:glycosyltransferase involved in cell wall biosynthesis
MKITVNAISAKLGGAVTYLQNVLPEMQRQIAGNRENHLVVWRGEAATGDQPWPDGIEYRENPVASGGASNPLHRLYFDQIQLPKRLRHDKSDVLFSSANYGPLHCPCHQVLLVRNSAYFDETYLRRMTSPKVKASQLFQRWLTIQCINSADSVLFPTQAMLDLVASHMRGARQNWFVTHYGTRHDLFYPATELNDLAASPVRLLHVSLYCDQKNLETLLQAVRFLHQLYPKRYSLKLTAGFEHGERIESAATPAFRSDQKLYFELREAGVAEDLKWRKYGSLPELYRSSDIFVFPSYTESFGHPLVEAMASGLAIVASDIPVNRELCRDAAVYCQPFDSQAFAAAIHQVAADPELRLRLTRAARERARAFTWSGHVNHLIKVFSK